MLPNLGFQELIVLGTIAVLLFGKRLPDVARSLGGSYRQFREGLADFQRQMDFGLNDTPSTRWKRPTPTYDDRQEATAPKFTPPVFTPPDAPAAEGTSDAGSSESSESAGVDSDDQSPVDSGEQSPVESSATEASREG